MASPKPKKYSSDRRERMRELQAEGKMTPEHGRLGGRPRKSATESQPRRASAVIAEVAQQNGDRIAGVLVDALLDPEATKTDRMRAIKMLIGTEFKVTEQEEDEANDPSRAAVTAADAEDAKAKLAAMLSDPVTGRRLRAVVAGALPPAGN